MLTGAKGKENIMKDMRHNIVSADVTLHRAAQGPANQTKGRLMHVCNIVYVSCGRHSSQPVEIAGLRTRTEGSSHTSQMRLVRSTQYAGIWFLLIWAHHTYIVHYSLYSIEAVLRIMNWTLEKTGYKAATPPTVIHCQCTLHNHGWINITW